MRVPRVVQLRMLLNVAHRPARSASCRWSGDVADVFWKSNSQEHGAARAARAAPQGRHRPWRLAVCRRVLATIVALAAFRSRALHRCQCGHSDGACDVAVAASFCCRRPTERDARPAGAVAATRPSLAATASFGEGAPLGELFSFVSGLYFRGKLTYARRFAAPPEPGNPIVGSGVHIITPNAGLRSPDTRVTRDAVRAFCAADIDADNAAYRAPLERSARALAREIGDCDVVLLGSIASPKYVDVLLEIFGDRLLFPVDFVGRGDMSRGGLLLRSAASGVGARVRAGRRRRPPRLAAAEAGPAMPRSRADHSARPRQRRRCASTARGPADQPPQDVLAGARLTKGDLLQYYADVSPCLLPHLARSRDGDEALSARRRRRVLLHEARAEPASRLDSHLPDRSRQQGRHRLSDD